MEQVAGNDPVYSSLEDLCVSINTSPALRAKLARLERFELPAHRLEICCSIRLSYSRISVVDDLGNDPSELKEHRIYSPGRLLNGILIH